MKQYIEMLGFKYADRVTGFVGVAESVCFDLYGCVQFILRAEVVAGTDGEVKVPDGRWFDASRLKKVSSDRVMEIPSFERLSAKEAVPGPADKSTVVRG